MDLKFRDTQIRQAAFDAVSQMASYRDGIQEAGDLRDGFGRHVDQYQDGCCDTALTPEAGVIDQVAMAAPAADQSAAALGAVYGNLLGATLASLGDAYDAGVLEGGSVYHHKSGWHGGGHPRFAPQNSGEVSEISLPDQTFSRRAALCRMAAHRRTGAAPQICKKPGSH